MKRKALGKGLRSLIPDAPPPVPVPPAAPATHAPTSRLPGDHLREIDLDLIRPNPRQPRRKIDDEALGELAQSIERTGVLQPVVVRPAGDGRFELVAGERRWRAAQMAGLLRLPAIVTDVPDDSLLEVALIENVQREQLDPIEEAHAYRSLADDLGLTQDEIASRVGKRRATIANRMRLLNLPRAVQDRIRDGRVSAGHAKALLAADPPARQIELAERVERDGLSVRQVEKLATREAGRTGSSPPPVDPNVIAAQETLQRELGTKVRIVPGKKGGRIELHCYSSEELDHVYELLREAARKRLPSGP